MISMYSKSGSISVFRVFRLLRIFKLAKSWKKLEMLIQTIITSLRDISSFSVLLFLLLFIYVLLGMDLLSDKYSDTFIIEEPRLNFNNFLNAFVLVFSVLTLELWDQIMFKYVRLHGSPVILYFVTLVILAVMIFLNLFLAILLENFDVDIDDHKEGAIQLLTRTKTVTSAAVAKVKLFFNRCMIRLNPLDNMGRDEEQS